MPHEGLQLLTLETLEQLDPVTVAEWQKKIEAANRDCQDRPTEKKKRRVALYYDVVPVSDVVGNEVQCIGLEAEFTIGSTQPSHSRGGKSLTVYADGRCAFNPLSPHNVQQRTLPIRGDAGEQVEEE